jgi:hypothetical protein
MGRLIDVGTVLGSYVLGAVVLRENVLTAVEL